MFDRSFKVALLAACVVYPLVSGLHALYDMIMMYFNEWHSFSAIEPLNIMLGSVFGNMRVGVVYLLPGLLLARGLMAARPGMHPLLRVLCVVFFVLANFFAVKLIDYLLVAIWTGHIFWFSVWHTDYIPLVAMLLYYVYVACLPEPERKLCRHPLRALRALLALLPKLMVGNVPPARQQPAPATMPEPTLAPVPFHIAPLRAAAIACVVSSLVFTLVLNTLAGQNISWLCVVSYMIGEPLFMLCPWLLLGQVVAQLPRRGGGLRVGSSCVFIALGVFLFGTSHVDAWGWMNLYKSHVMTDSVTRSAELMRLLLLDVLYVIPPFIVGLVSHVRLLRRLSLPTQSISEKEES